MKLLQFAIASIVDANTGNGLAHSPERIDYATAECAARRIRSRSFIDFLRQIGNGISAARVALRARREQQRNLHSLSRLNDYLLDDIGFSRGDILAAEYGQIDLAQLESRRASNRRSGQIQLLNRIAVADNLETGSALNEAAFARAKCA